MTEAKKPRAPKGQGTISPRPDGTFRGYVPTATGRPKYFSADTYQEALDEQRRLLNKRDQGVLTAGVAPTVEAWLTHFIETSAENGDHKKSTTSGYRRAMKRITPAFGSVKLDQLMPEMLEEFYAGMRKEGLSEKYIYGHHALISVGLTRAMWRGHVHRNVAQLVKAPSQKRRSGKKVKTFRDSEVTAILAAAVGHRFEARWNLALDYGLRPSEALGLTWHDLDTEEGTLTINGQLQWVQDVGLLYVPSTKTEEGQRTLRLAPGTVDMLVEHRRKQLLAMANDPAWVGFEWEGVPMALMFTVGHGRPLQHRYDTALWTALLAKAGVPYSDRYTARHTAASTLLADGEDIAVAAEMLGHTQTAFTFNTYVHSTGSDKVADRIAARHAARAAAR